jgi:flagellar protein FliL
MAQAQEPAPTAGRGGKGLLLGVAGALVLGGVGFAAVYTGAVASLLGREGDPSSAVQPLEAVSFVPVDPIVIAMPPGAAARHLRFSAHLEVAPAHAAEVASLMPRIVDALNGYLRALEVADFEQPAATVVLRAQMLRRVQLATGEGRVRDLLISEFVLN